MKTRLSVLTLLLAVLLNWTVVAAAAPTPGISAGFDAANKLYEEGKFKEAVAGYEKLVQSGSVSAAMYFNLGNALFKSGEIGRAIAAYRQAERLAPRDPDIRANLQFLRDRVQGPTLLPNRWQRWLGRLTLNEWAVLASAVFWAWLIVMAVIQFRPAVKQRLKSLVWLGAVATVVLCAGLGAVWSAETAKSAIVIAPDVIVRNGPLSESQRAFTVHDGAELSVLDTRNDWLQVTDGGRRIGWLRRDQVLLEPQRM